MRPAPAPSNSGSAHINAVAISRSVTIPRARVNREGNTEALGASMTPRYLTATFGDVSDCTPARRWPMCNQEHRRTVATGDTRRMHIAQLSTPLFVTWLASLTLAGAFGSFGIAGWALLATLGAVPLIVVRQIGREPAPTLSESINAARR